MSTPAPETYISGFTLCTTADEEQPRHGSDYELYCDDRKGIFRTAIYEDNVFTAWRERVFVRPEEIAALREVANMLIEAKPW